MRLDFYIFIVIFDCTFKYKVNNDLESNDDLFYAFINYMFVTELEQTKNQLDLTKHIQIKPN